MTKIIPWNEPWRLTYLGRKIHLCVPAKFYGYMDVVVDGGLNTNLTVMRFPDCGKGLKVLPEEPAAPDVWPSTPRTFPDTLPGIDKMMRNQPTTPNVDMGKDWEWFDQTWQSRAGIKYLGRMDDGRHVLKDDWPDGSIFMTEAVRNIEPKPEPAPFVGSETVFWAIVTDGSLPVERNHLVSTFCFENKKNAEDYKKHFNLRGPVRPVTFADTPEPAPSAEPVAWAVIYPGGGFYASRFTKSAAQDEANRIGGTVRPLYLHPLKPKGRSLGWFNIYHTGASRPHKTRADADAHKLSERLACVEIFEGEGL